MRKVLLIIFFLSIVSPSFYGFGAQSKEVPPSTDLSQKELEKLVQPIALYPDLLLQQVLAASTFPEQILDAALYNEQGKDPQGISSQPWDDSVKGLANYPSILGKMAGDLDWTISLGSAFINQNQALRNAVQTMRSKAATVGNLKSTDNQDVITDKGSDGTTIIRIESSDPQVIYVPTSTTTVVYEKPVSTTNYWAPVASFGLGMALGYAIGDSHDDHYYYGGGYYGPGFWHGHAAEDWVDYRHDRWDDAYDFARDRQDWHQNNRDDWREYRQDLGRKQQEWRNEQKQRPANMSPEKRAEASSRLNSAKASWQGKSPEQRREAAKSGSLNGVKSNGNLSQAKSAAQSRGTFSRAGSANYGSVDRNAATQRLNQAKSNPQLEQRAQNFRSNSPTVKSRSDLGSRNLGNKSVASSSYASNRGGGLSGLGSSRSSINQARSRGSSSMSFGGGSRGVSRGGGGGGRSFGGRRR